MITGIKAKKILDSRGKPSVECRIETERGDVKTSIPCGASRGDYEAFFIDNEEALKNINGIIAKKLQGMEIDQKVIDELLIKMDGTDNKKNLGANAILPVSIAVCKAGALARGVPLYKYIQELSGARLAIPKPMMVFIEGGKHSHPEFASTDVQEFMVVPDGKTFEESMEIGRQVYKKLGDYLASKNLSIEIGDEGAFIPKLASNENAIEILTNVIEGSGYKKCVSIAIDAAASEFYQNGIYSLRKEKKGMSSSDLIELYEEWVGKYPITSIEDGLSQHDAESWKELMKGLGKKVNIVGDDLTVTNMERLKMVKDRINAVIVKPTQIGTVSETISFSNMASENKMDIVVSQRGGETMDTFKSDLCVAIGGKFAKFGAPSRPERIVKYDRLLEIEKELAHQ